MNTNTSIVLVTAGTVGMLCFVTGLAMIYEPAALIALGIAIVAAALAVAYVNGSST